jgi:hypothetical protein
MCAQLWVSKAQVGGGEGLKLVVVEGRVSVTDHARCEHRLGYAACALERRLSGVGLEVLLGVLLGCMPGGASHRSFPGGRTALARTQRALCFARSISAVSSC